ncbi:hypothetical protein GmHk_14G040948 [Glycine max]|nr:hypothetical protein GmHk_14G040948 [Glycine max]
MAITPHMSWHSENLRNPNVMCHPSDGETWKHFDRMYPEFSLDPRNVKLGLCSNRFLVLMMADRGRGGGRRTFNRDRRRDVKPLIHVVAPTLNTLPTAQDQPNLTFVRESIPTTLVGDASPLASDDSLTPEYPPNPNCEHIADRRLFIHAHKGEFQPAYGCSNIVSGIIRENFDELTASWLKVSIDLHNRWFREFKTKGSHILKNAMNKIKNGQDKATWILANVRTTLYQHWGSTNFLNKSFTAKAN